MKNRLPALLHNVRIPVFCFFAAVVYCFVLESASAEETKKVTLYYEIAAYNQKYNDHRYVDSPKASFSSSMNSSSFEFHSGSAGSVTWGVGYAGACITANTFDNYDKIEELPFTFINMPYLFAGYDFGFWCYEIGVSEYITMQSFHSRDRYAENGEKKNVSGSTFGINNCESFTFVNFLLRFLPEDSFHVKLRFGREKFAVVDSLYNAAFVLPVKNHSLELTASLTNPLDFFVDDNRRVKSNQRISLIYGYSLGAIDLYAGLGVLAFNQHGGQSPVPLEKRFSGSIGVTASF